MPIGNKGQENARQNFLVTIDETVSGVLDTAGIPILGLDINTEGNGFDNIQRFTEHLPDGFDAINGASLEGDEGQVSGNFMPYYGLMEHRFNGLAGPPVSEVTLPDGRIMQKWKLPDFGDSIERVTHSAYYGSKGSAYALLYGKIQQLAVECARTGAVSGNITLHYNKIQRNQTMTAIFTESDASYRIVGANVTEAVTLLVSVGDLAEEVVINIGDNAAAIEAAFAAALDDVVVDATGSIATSSGETHTLTATNVTGPATIYTNITVNPAVSASDLQTLVRAKGGNYANVVVAGSTTAISNGANLLTGGTASATNSAGGLGPEKAVDGSNSQAWVAQNSLPQTWSYDRGVSAVDSPAVTLQLNDDNSTIGLLKDFTVETSSNLSAWTTLGTFTNIAPSNGTAQNLSLTGTLRRYVRIVITGSNDGAGTFFAAIGEVKILSTPTTSSGSYTFAFPSGVGNVPDISATGTGWATSVTQAGNAGGTVNIVFVNPESTRVYITLVDPEAGYSIQALDIGSDGSGPEAKEGYYLEPTHILCYKAESFADLNTIKMGISQDEFDDDNPFPDFNDSHIIRTAQANAISFEGMVNPVYFESRKLNPESHVDGEKTIGASITLPKDKDGRCEEIYATEMNPDGGCGAKPWYFRQAYKCGEWEVWFDLYCVRNAKPNFPVENNISQRQFPLRRHFNPAGSCIMTLIKPA